MLKKYKCPICERVNEESSKVSSYRCRACTRIVRTVEFEEPKALKRKTNRKKKKEDERKVI